VIEQYNYNGEEVKTIVNPVYETENGDQFEYDYNWTSIKLAIEDKKRFVDQNTDTSSWILYKQILQPEILINEYFIDKPEEEML
jgi:hypothetical protein